MKNITRLSFVVLAVAAAFTILAQAQAADARRAPTVEDLMALKSVGAVRASRPTGPGSPTRSPRPTSSRTPTSPRSGWPTSRPERSSS